MEKRHLTYCDLGLIDYQDAWNLQKDIFELRSKNEISDTFLLLEHPNTYTLGKVAHKSNLIGSNEYLEQNQISVYDIDRGGDITYHGPGQIVGYPIIDLNNWIRDTHKYLRALEEVLIITCKHFNLTCTRNPLHTGVWIENRKIAAIGIKVSRWITMHGFAFNVNTNLSLFQGIIPCGIADKEVTSLQKELGQEFDILQIKELLLENFANIFNYNSLSEISIDSLKIVS
ncbi:MAG: lipoyl(octanoyl) transferase LipB [Ignavibacteriaceae bacterium]|nr:lipoyl(octanoyl) transferase LipB [Ignavibacteriaceae bacterium]